MWIFVAAVVVVAVGALVAAALMRPGGDDVSVRSYHSALGTLEHLSQPERRVRRPVGRDPGDAGPPDDPSQSVPPVEVRGTEEFPDPVEPIVFDDARPKDRYRPPPTQERTAPARARRAQKMALDSMERRPRRGIGVALVVVALVAFAALAFVGSRRSHTPAHANTARSTHQSATSTTVHQSSSGHSPARSQTSTTTTTAPSQIVPLSSSSTGTSATYGVGKNAFTVLISASAPCWVKVTTVATGTSLWTGTLQPGGTQSVSATGATTVELGATGATMTVDSTPVVLPTAMHAPFVATFQPTAPAPPPATTPPSAG
jgi:hypothetical protein